MKLHPPSSSFMQRQWKREEQVWFYFNYGARNFSIYLQYSRKHSMINHCDRCNSSWWFRYIFCSIKYIFKISFTFRVLFITITQFRLSKISKYIKQTERYPNHQEEWYIYHSDLSYNVSDCTVLPVPAVVHEDNFNHKQL